MRNILLLDMFNIYYRVANVENKEKDVVKRTLNLITHHSQELGLKWDAVYCCFDSHKYHRKLIYNDYKANRGTPSELSGAVLSVSTILQQLGFAVLKYEGFEADDIIAKLCQQYKDDKKVIVSTDEDLFQLLDATTIIYKNRKLPLITEQSFRQGYGIDPKDWVVVKSLMGCASDNIPGIPGIGEKTAIACIREETVDKDAKIIAHHKMVLMNVKLVKLPFNDRGQKLPDIPWQQFEFNTEFLRMFTDYPADLYEKVWLHQQPSLFDVFESV